MRLLMVIGATLCAGVLSAAPDDGVDGRRNLLMAGVPPPPDVVEMLPKVAAAVGCELAVTVEQATAEAAARSETDAFDWVEATKAKIVPERPPTGRWDYVAMRRPFADLERIRGECVQFSLKYANALPKAEIVVVEPLDYAQHRGAYDFALQKSLRVAPVGTAARLLDGDGGDAVATQGKTDGGDAAFGYLRSVATQGAKYAYLESLVWVAKLFGVKVTGCPYVPEGLSADVAARIRRAAQDAVDGVLVPPEKGGAVVPADVAAAMAKIRAASVPQSEVQEVEYAPGVGLRVFLLLRPSAVSRIRCEVHLPDPGKWDGRLWGLGCGGWPEMRTDYVLGPSDSAVVKCDMGTLRFLPEKDPVHPEVRKDFGWRATHLATVEAKRLVRLLYGRGPAHSYFFGSSTGGRQAVGEARRFPEDYDGIIAGVPALDPIAHALPVWIHARLKAKYGTWFTETQMKAVAEAELAYFAKTDPEIARGRFIDDPRPTPEKLDGVWREALGRDPSLAGLEKMWRELFAPVRIRGLRVFPGFVLGTEFAGPPSDFHLDTLFGKRPLAEFSEEEMLALLDEPDYSMRDANLARFAARGGKLITFGGLEDESVPPLPVTAHYERALATLGEETVRDFFVHYLIPGRKHAPGTWTRHGATGDPANLRETIQDWVEKGVRPDVLTVPLLEEKGKSIRIAPYPEVGVRSQTATPETSGPAYVPTEGNLAHRRAFAADKFGIFIHWGLYAQYAQGEWYMWTGNLAAKEYAKAAGGFCPAAFDAGEWARAFRRAGARYVTITSRHHDGFSIFDTKASDCSVMNTPFRRDILRELADACRKEGLKIGFYYSLLDWTREDYPWQAMGKEHNGRGYGRDPAKQDYDSYLSFMKTQLSELLTNYGPVNCIWFDGEWATRGVSFDWRLGEVYRHIHAIRPDCLIVNNHHHLAVSEEDVQTFEKDLPGESKSGFTRGQKISTDVPLETCDTMGESWGYKIAEAGRWKTPEALVKMLVGAAGKGANLLLNVGPRADGRIPEEALARLAFFGTWLGQYGETVYGTVAGPVKSGEDVVSTRKGDEIYVHVFDAKLRELVCTLQEKVTDVTAFAGGGKLSFAQTPDGTVRVTLPASDAFDRVIRLKVN